MPFKYDAEGREALRFLPAPQAGRSLEYARRFNLADPNTDSCSATPAGDAAAIAPYDLEHYDGVKPQCSSTLSGAGQYYSAANPRDGRFSTYVPDAEGYPFSADRYAPDGSGRLRARSGVGRELALDAHDTRHYELSSNLDQLKQFFGRNNAGLVDHFRRRIIRDANGRLSVSHEDSAGRTVATSLIGPPPPILEPLDHDPAQDGPKTFALDVGQANPDSGEKRALDAFYLDAVPASGRVPLTYRLDLTSLDGADPGEICIDCEFELEIEVYGPGGSPTLLSIDSSASSSECRLANDASLLRCTFSKHRSSTCGSGARDKHVEVRFAAVVTSDGEYRVSKVLRTRTPDIRIISRQTETILGEMPEQLSGEYLSAADSSVCAGDCETACKMKYAEGDAQRGTCLDECAAFAGWPTQHAGDLVDIQDLSTYEIGEDGELIAFDSPAQSGTSTEDQQCQQPGIDLDYELRMMSIQIYTDAAEEGYLNPLGMNFAPGLPDGTSRLAVDPDFPHRSIQYLRMSHRLIYYTAGVAFCPDDSRPLSLWEFVAQPALRSGNPGPVVAKDAQWRLFRSLYIALKAEVLPGRYDVPAECALSDEDPLMANLPSDGDPADTADEGLHSFNEEHYCPTYAEQQIADLKAGRGAISMTERRKN